MKKILLTTFVLYFSLLFYPVPIFAIDTLPTEKPIKILLVPGHDDEVWGAQYGNMKEASMNLRLATEIYNQLKKNKKFEVWITRDQDGYTKEFADYFKNNEQEILAFKDAGKQKTQTAIAAGVFLEKKVVSHVPASKETALKLYGINKWAVDNTVDAIIHVHFNDYPRKTKWTMGKYTGFAIYFPESQMSNSKESEQLAQNIFKQLSTKYITSTYFKEKGGLIPDQKLIAMGVYNTLTEKVKSVLIEYGYIYKFGDNKLRHQAYKAMASLTVKALEETFH